MLDILDKHGAVPLYLQVKQKVRDAILDGTLTHRVPSERELARRYNIAQMTARRALMELVDEGILYREVGRGTFVCTPGTAPRKTYCIGFALCPKVSDGIYNPYFSRVLRGVEQTCRAHSYSVLFTSEVGELVDTAGADPWSHSRRKVDGILAAAIGDEAVVRRSARIVPTVVLDNVFEGLSSVVADNVSGGYKATAHLLALGHTRIGHLAGDPTSAVGRDRMAGYQRALAEHGLVAAQELVCFCGFDFDSGHAGAEQLASLSPPPTAVFCVNDAVALGAMKRFKERGLEIPGDISLVGFDDIEPASIVEPPLTTVHVPQEEIGALAVEVLLSLIHRAATEAPLEQRLVEVSLVERASCRPL